MTSANKIYQSAKLKVRGGGGWGGCASLFYVVVINNINSASDQIA